LVAMCSPGEFAGISLTAETHGSAQIASAGGRT